MTTETAIWCLLDAGAGLDVEGDRIILDVPDEAVAARIPPEAVAVLKADKFVALEIIRRMRDRGRAHVACLCVCCGVSFPMNEDGASWLPCPDGGSWPRCPVCTDRGRGTEVLSPPARPRRRAA